MGDKTFFKNIKLRVHYLTKLDAHPYNFGTLVHLFVFFLGGRRGGGGGQNPYFKSAFYGFSNSIGTIILEEQPSWDIFRLVIIFSHYGLRTDFRVSQEVAGAGQNVRIFLESPFHGLSDGI